MEPATASLVLGGVGALSSAVGSAKAGAATAASDRYNAQVQENNAVVAEQNAAYAEAAGIANAQNISLKGAANFGHVKASQAASGVDVNSGSAVEVQKSTRELNQLEAMSEENKGMLQAYGYRAAAVSSTAQAGLDRMAADNAESAGFLSAGGGLLGSASTLGFKWAGSSAPAAAPFSYGYM